MVRAAGSRGYIEVMQGCGHDPAPLLARYRIAAAAYDHDDALISQDALAGLLETSSIEAGCPDLGLRIAAGYDIANLGALGVVVQSAATAREALRMASRYLFIHGSGISLSLGPSELVPDALELCMEVRLTGQAPHRQIVDLTLGAAHKCFGTFLGAAYDLRLVTLPHQPLAPLATYRQLFGTGVIAGQGHASLHLGLGALNAPLQGRNPALRQITEDYLSRYFRASPDSITDRVRLALRQMLGTRHASKDEVAAMLGLHPRTLHRRLRDEGTGFEEIREALRQELALQYLRDTRIPLAQLSGILGFPEQSALSRACRRWFGKSPSAVRKGAV